MKTFLVILRAVYFILAAAAMMEFSQNIHHKIFAWHSEKYNNRLMGDAKISAVVPACTWVFLGYSTVKRDGEEKAHD